jgi:hypothetical protein
MEWAGGQNDSEFGEGARRTALILRNILARKSARHRIHPWRAGNFTVLLAEDTL